MALHKSNKGIDLPISGRPLQSITAPLEVTQVAVIGDDFPGLKPMVLVAPGEHVLRGQPVIEDRAVPGVVHTAPGAGRVIAVNRGHRRVLQSIVIELSDSETRNAAEPSMHQPFPAFSAVDANSLKRADIVSLLVESGAWPAFRARPFGKVPSPNSTSAALFVTAMDTNPLTVDPELVLAAVRDDFELGLRIVAKLTDGPTYLCVRPGSDIAGNIDAPVTVEEFAGPHPAGTVGYHVHCLRPVSKRHTVWTIGYQDVVAIARLCRTGHLDVSRVISVGGPEVANPRIVQARLGASVADLAPGEDLSDGVRWISGSVISGKAVRPPAFGFLGRYDVQLSAIREDPERELFGWCAPGRKKFSVVPAFVSRMFRNTGVEFTTSTHGSQRAIVPIGVYERVMPMDIQPTFLLRSIVVDDVARAEELGVLELCEEDVALCTFVCPGKIDYGPPLRRVLNTIEKAW